MESKYLTVSALNKYLYYKFDTDLNLRNVYLKAEISNLRLSKGILYFVLKDSEAEIDGLMYQSIIEKLKFKPIDGMTVLVNGKVSIYAKRGSYAITIVNMEEVGLGEAYLNFIRLKEKLTNEGYFDDSRKLPIPRISNKIGVITSGTGDAMHDIFSTIEKRFPLSSIVFYPAIVQGKDAPQSLINAVERANKDKLVDVIIIARGGGTVEDLSCFNDEQLAMAIFHSKIPTISGVGHEADFTICDFVSSRRAPTPTGAAVIATPDRYDLLKDFNNIESTLVNSIKFVLTNKFNEYQYLISRPSFSNFQEKINWQINEVNQIERHLTSLSPQMQIKNHDKDLNLCIKDLNVLFTNKITDNEKNIKEILNKLIILNPLNLMSKGYAIVEQSNHVVTSIDDIIDEEQLLIRLSDGVINASIIGKRKI